MRALTALKVSRDACMDVKSTAPSSGHKYKASINIIRAIDAFAEALTGNPYHFWNESFAAARRPDARAAVAKAMQKTRATKRARPRT